VYYLLDIEYVDCKSMIEEAG